MMINAGNNPDATQNARTIPLKALLIGDVRPLGARGIPSGIVKEAVRRPLMLTLTGFEGDGQGDTVKHGGPEKAVHHYPFDHHAAWIREIGEHPLMGAPGAFGENLSTAGITETDVAIGDVFRLGEAVVEVSQGRQPCFKLNERFGRDDMAVGVQKSGRTGWYYRVREPGRVAPEAELRLLDRQAPDWTIHRLWHLFYVDRLNREGLEGIASLPLLADSWRALARKRLESGVVEDWSARLQGRSPAR
ncbi:MOSC domain-containing protein YiiM [Gellertiella hungarica]|uniref:MOSC domain-containing protein YiiM n=2 Tax=Gellertiella hungarica TaxID=1572859 RepID=A0A7W6NJQ4_9HYPH|nr:MOSC domain-containing protein YiiM [Gellertiella hungarica]